MKKTLAILLTLIFTFSCFSILGTNVALAEETKLYQTEIVMESDFDDSNGTNWQGTKSNVTFMDENGDGVNDFARVNSSASQKGAGLVSNPFSLIPGTEYELSFEIRIPKDLSKSYLIGGSTFYAPNILIYEPNLNSSGTKVSSIPQIANTSTGNNLYAYNQSANADKGIEAWSRRPTFKADWQVGNYGTVSKEKYSHLAYTDHKELLGATTDAADAYSEWTTITANFTAVADEDGETSQIAAVGFNFQELKSDGYVFDVKNVKLVSKKEIKQTYILESDFNDADGTNWRYTNNDVTYCDDNGDGVNDYASVKVNANNQNAGLFSTPFNLVPGNDYELTYYIRVPEESRSFLIGSTFYAPTVAFYQPKVNSTGTKVESTPAVSTVEATNNFYAYKYTNTDDPTQNWSRRSGFSATWTIDGYTPKVITNFSDFDYRYYTAVLGATNADLNEAFEDWTKVTVNFTALANTEDEKSQVTAVGFYYGSYKSSDNFVFDIKDVKLLETADAVVKEPEITEDVVYYEGFESLADPTSAVTVYSGVNANPTWLEPTISAGDATTGKNSYSVYAMYQNIFIPLDKSKLVNDTVYSVSLDWKMLEYTDAKQRTINNIYLVGYTPEDGVAFKDNHKAIAGVANKKGTGKWENATFNFKITDYSEFEQYGIYIYYKTTGTNTDPDDRIYLDTILVKESADQTIVDPLEIKEEARTEDTIKVLAFGNSFSNDGTSFIPQIAAADGKDIRVGDCSIGGCPISKHYNNAITNNPAYTFSYRQASGSIGYGNSITMRQALEATDWDYITIQQVSTQSGNYNTFNYQLEHLINYFKEVCPNAKILLHSTWAYKDGIEKDGYELYDNDQVTMYNAIKDTYLKASRDYGYLQIIPTGEAIQRLRGQMSDTLFTTETDPTEEEIAAGVSADKGNFTRDGFHLSEKGRVAAALVWYEIFTGVSAVDCNIDLTKAISTLAANNGANMGITAEEEIAIKNAAHEASALYKKANETQLAIEAIGEVNANSGDAIAKANALRAELNDDTFLPNLQTLIDANETFNNLEPEVPAILYSVNVSGENGYVYGNGEYEEGTDVSVTAAPYGDYQFDGWYENDVKVSDEQIYTFTITANRTLVAKFVPLVTEYIPDINSDDLVNLKDLVTLAQYVANWDVTVNPAVTDVDGNGTTELNDVNVLARHLAGWDVKDEMVSEISAMPYEDLTDANLKTTLLAGESDYFNQSTVINKGNQALIAKAIKKAQNGENLTIASIGGSVTQGVKDADGNDRSYGKLVSEWFEETFGITVKNVNAGIGSTGSNVGIYRLDANVLRYNPDLVLVDYCVNDISLENSDFIYRETYEAIIRKVLSEEIPVIAVAFGSTNYSDPKRATTALTTGHIPTLLYYDVPVIDHYGALWRYIDAGVADWYKYTESEDGTKTATEDSLTKDGLHPSIVGHVMISSAINAYIESVYENIENVDTTVPALPEKTFFKDTVAYENAAFLVSNAKYSPGYTVIEATENENEAFSAASVGNSLLGTGWKCKTAGASVTFELKNVTALTLFLYQSKKEGEYGKGSIIINGETVVDNKSTKSTSNHVWPYYDVVYDTPQDITLTFVCNEGVLMVPSIGVAMQP